MQQITKVAPIHDQNHLGTLQRLIIKISKPAPN